MKAQEVVTVKHLEDLKQEVIQAIQKNTREQTSSKEWLKSFEVRKLLKISPGTLQNLRIKGIISYSKFGDTLYYPLEGIMKVLEENLSTKPY